MSTAALIPVEEYLRRTEKPNCEYIDGVLAEVLVVRAAPSVAAIFRVALVGVTESMLIPDLSFFKRNLPIAY